MPEDFEHDPRLAFGIEELAVLLGVRPYYIRLAIRGQLLPAKRLGGRTRIWREDIERWWHTLPEQHKRGQRKETTP